MKTRPGKIVGFGRWLGYCEEVQKDNEHETQKCIKMVSKVS